MRGEPNAAEHGGKRRAREPSPQALRAPVLALRRVDRVGDAVGGALEPLQRLLDSGRLRRLEDRLQLREVGPDLGTVCVEELGEADYFPKSAPWILARVAA